MLENNLYVTFIYEQTSESRGKSSFILLTGCTLSGMNRGKVYLYIYLCTSCKTVHSVRVCLWESCRCVYIFICSEATTVKLPLVNIDWSCPSEQSVDVLMCNK